METILEVQGLVKHFPLPGSRAKVQAVNNISFCISKGETLALVGESGSGKTTVGRCVLGLLEATAGSIRFRGGEMGKRRHVRTPELRGRMQLVFQEPAERFTDDSNRETVLGWTSIRALLQPPFQ